MEWLTYKLQTSTSGPYSLPGMKSSGAAYSGLPQWVCSKLPGLAALLRPKSKKSKKGGYGPREKTVTPNFSGTPRFRHFWDWGKVSWYFVCEVSCIELQGDETKCPDHTGRPGGYISSATIEATHLIMPLNVHCLAQPLCKGHYPLEAVHKRVSFVRRLVFKLCSPI